MTMLIGLHGKAQSGKDTVAGILRDLYDFKRMAFADPLKEAATILFGVKREEAFADDFKSTRLSYWDRTWREIIQQFGTESMRDVFGQDFWVKRWYLDWIKLEHAHHVVISDVRFENEAARIRELGGVVVHLHRPEAGLSGNEAKHRSESGIAFDAEADCRLDNDGNIAQLTVKVDALVDLIQREGSMMGWNR